MLTNSLLSLILNHSGNEFDRPILFFLFLFLTGPVLAIVSEHTAGLSELSDLSLREVSSTIMERLHSLHAFSSLVHSTKSAISSLRSTTLDIFRNPYPFDTVDDLWLSGGSVILRAQNKGFKVYRGILLDKSPVFRSMEAFSRSDNENLPVVEGCPIVDMTDNADELYLFLKAVYDSSFFLPYPSKSTYEMVTAILRLSTKYDVPYLRRRALRHLTSSIPTKLSEYPVPPQASVEFDYQEHSGHLVSLAREVNAPWLLPFVRYWMSIHISHTDPSNPDSPLGVFNDDNLRPILSLKSKVETERADVSAKILDREQCRGVRSCRRFRAQFAFARLWSEDGPYKQVDATEENIIREQCCDHCARDVIDLLVRFDEDFETDLPSLLLLTSWTRLNADKEKALEIKESVAPFVSF